MHIERAPRPVPPGGVGGAPLGVLRRGAPLGAGLRARRRVAAAGARARAHTAGPQEHRRPT